MSEFLDPNKLKPGDLLRIDYPTGLWSPFEVEIPRDTKINAGDIVTVLKSPYAHYGQGILVLFNNQPYILYTYEYCNGYDVPTCSLIKEDYNG